MQNDSLKLQNQVCHRLYVAANAFTRAYRPYLDHLNLTYPQYVVMMGLWEKDHVLIGELHDITQIDSGALSLIIKKLQKKGVIKVVGLEKDKRKKCIQLTKEGFKLKEKALSFSNRLSCKEITLKPEDISQLMQLLDDLKNQLVN